MGDAEDFSAVRAGVDEASAEDGSGELACDQPIQFLLTVRAEGTEVVAFFNGEVHGWFLVSRAMGRISLWSLCAMWCPVGER